MDNMENPVYKERRTKMEKFYTKNGLIAYKTTTAEIQSIGGLGICDECGQFHPEGGFLVPVLNHWQCEACFNECKDRLQKYPEDMLYEARRAEYYEARIPVTAREEQETEQEPAHTEEILPCRMCGEAARIDTAELFDGTCIVQVRCSGGHRIDSSSDSIMVRDDNMKRAEKEAIRLWNEQNSHPAEK